VLTDTQQGRVLVGLADQRSLAAFLLGQRQRIIDKAVCFYEPKPALLVCGWMNHLGALLSEVKSQVELIQAPTARRAAQMLSERAVPALLVIEDGHMTADEERALCQQARSRSVPWIIAAQHPDAAREIDTLSKGAIEYLSVAGNTKASRARLMRILSDRFRLSSQGGRDPTDPLTRLPTRRVLLERLEDAWVAARGHGEPISLVLLNLIGFKGYNKAHGYLSGDAVLRLLAQGFQRLATGRGQLVVRFSGNEFALLLPGVDATEAAQTADQMRLVVAAASIENRADADQGQLLARTGVCSVVPGEHSSLYTLIDGAHSTLNTHDEQGV
jgi:diguanylate cyclase (GGDEF)-like protein